MRNIVVKSSIKLTGAQREALEDGINKKTKQKFKYTYLIENDIAGILIFDGDRLIDATLTSELCKIKKNYENLILKENLGLSYSEIPEFIKNKLNTLIDHSIDVDIYGSVISILDGIVTIQGLPTCKNGELILIGKDNCPALVMNLENVVGAILLDDNDKVEIGDIAFSTNRILQVPIGEKLLGRVVSPLGEPIDDNGKIKSTKFGLVERSATPIIDRDKVEEPLYTGILSIDSMVPIGKGQRELILGDRQTGKTAIAIDAILNQVGKNVYCVYVAIGQKASMVSKIVQTLKKANAFNHTVVVCSTASDSPALQYIAPYAATAIAEGFMFDGKDVLIIYDDLSKHAVAYRTISLLLKRPAGREAYPGDIFYIHSKLLERAAKLDKRLGGGSLTALPIIETQAGDISSYIPTNVISITDGQIYLERELFNAGIRPAINVGLSVSRVGGKAQNKIVGKLSSKIRLNLSHYKELQIFSQFGTSIDTQTREILEEGSKIVEALKQKDTHIYNVLKEEIFLFAIGGGLLAHVEVSQVKDFLESYYEYILVYLKSKYTSIQSLEDLTEEQLLKIQTLSNEYAIKYRLDNAWKQTLLT